MSSIISVIFKKLHYLLAVSRNLKFAVCLSRGRRRQKKRMKSLSGWIKALWTNSSNRLVYFPVLSFPSFSVSDYYFPFTHQQVYSCLTSCLKLKSRSFSYYSLSIIPPRTVNLTVIVFQSELQ